MILRAMLLAACGCAAALGSMKLALEGFVAAPQQAMVAYHEMPLMALPVIRDGRLRGLAFVRLGVAMATADKPVPTEQLEAIVADATHQIAFGGPDRASIDLAAIKSGIPPIAKASGLRVTEIAVLQSHFRPADRSVSRK